MQCWFECQLSNEWKSVTLASHDQMGHVASCLNHLDLANKLVTLTMLPVSCASETDASSITWPKESCHILFQLSSPNEQNDAIDDAVSMELTALLVIMESNDWKLCFTSFCLMWPDECNSAIDKTFSITNFMSRQCSDLSIYCLDICRYMKTYYIRFLQNMKNYMGFNALKSKELRAGQGWNLLWESLETSHDAIISLPLRNHVWC